MYFGTRERGEWVKAPAPGAGFGAVGYSDSLIYLNGGALQRNSSNAHMEYEMSWGSVTRDEVAQIEDYAYGLYGTGLTYILDPVAADRNQFNRSWSAPKITAEDGVPLTGTVRPTLALIGDTTLDYPLHAAQYAITAGQASRKFYCPIPLGYTAWIGCHGTVNARGLKVQPTAKGTNSGAAVLIPTTAVTDVARFGGSVSGASGIDGIDITIDTTATTTLTLCGLMLQVLPTGVTPSDGGYISGRGSNGCIFERKPNVMPYSIPGESMGMTAKLVEVGDWL
jgi:hypothetical protein